MQEKKEPSINYAIEELFSSEKVYRDKLTFLKDAFSKDELVGNQPILNKFKELIPQLINHSIKIHQNVAYGFLLSQKIEAGNASTTEIEKFNQLRAERAHLFALYFRTYQEYAETYLAFAPISGDGRGFQAMKEYISANNTQGFGLADYLIDPVQRGPRYDILVAAVIKFNETLSEESPVKLKEEQIQEVQRISAHIKLCAQAANKATSEMKKGYEFGDYSKAATQKVIQGIGYISSYLSSRYQKDNTPQAASAKSEQSEKIDLPHLNISSSLLDGFEPAGVPDELDIDDFEFLDFSEENSKSTFNY
ncbi:RhoGEF domain protein [Legionella birminghamensis]|uniref:RhoGEF domain n=1 Tax=Legionella birminghamensis TaxID=28083 RepID=A0A378IBY0_9GAMM|nr:RhoGEF domain-containing protein [Legionella birminghamensis]KTC71747.1 RhoGEF domain protein [Legionella birminghamensis]STX32416.1 RhoGEF domain [Legionella birminghamensis]